MRRVCCLNMLLDEFMSYDTEATSILLLLAQRATSHIQLLHLI